MGGNGAHCPGCDRLLKIPSPEDGVVPQGVSKVNYQQAGLSSLEIRHDEATKEGQWKSQRRQEVSRLEEEDKALRWMLPIGLTALIILAGLAFLLITSDDVEVDDSVVVDKVFSVENDAKNAQESRLFDHQNAADAARLKEFLNEMYAASTVDELIKFCRPTKGLKQRMEKHYETNELSTRKVRKLKRSQPYTRMPGFMIFSAETSNYKLDQGVIEYDDGKFMLDWDSYVAYSEMTWEEMMRKKPTDPVLLRLLVREGSYYNNDFKDERKWLSLTISNPHEKDVVLHAYVRRKSAVEQQVTNFGMNMDGYAVTVKAHYPKNAKANDQIIISEVIRDNWIQE